jgi:hypothetical protein
MEQARIDHTIDEDTILHHPRLGVKDLAGGYVPVKRLIKALQMGKFTEAITRLGYLISVHPPIQVPSGGHTLTVD